MLILAVMNASFQNTHWLYGSFLLKFVLFASFLGLSFGEDERSGYVVTVSPAGVANSSYTEMIGLVDSKLFGYDTRVRPRLWQGNPVDVNTSFVPMAIVDLDINRQTMTVNGYFVVSWIDEKITWDKTGFSGTNIIRIPLKNIWYPQLILREVST